MMILLKSLNKGGGILFRGKKLSSKARKELKNMGYRRLAGMTVAGTAGEQAMMYSANRLGITPDQRQAIETLGPSYAMGENGYDNFGTVLRKVQVNLTYTHSSTLTKPCLANPGPHSA